jgi:hypothetical protein
LKKNPNQTNKNIQKTKRERGGDTRQDNRETLLNQKDAVP